jgi:hypothetical protein
MIHCPFCSAITRDEDSAEDEYWYPGFILGDKFFPLLVCPSCTILHIVVQEWEGYLKPDRPFSLLD